MTDGAEKMKDQLMELPEADRAALANMLFHSLSTIRDDGWDAAWAAECDRRWQQIVSGEARLIPADEALRDARARLEKLREAR